MAEPWLRPTIARALGVLASERPAAHERLAMGLASTTVGVCVDDEQVLWSVSGAVDCTPEEAEAADVVVRTQHAEVVALGTGQVALLDAVCADRVRLRGSVPALGRAHGALVAFLEGAARSPGMGAVWRDVVGRGS